MKFPPRAVAFSSLTPVLAGLFVTSAHAQPPSPAPSTLPTVVVSATRLEQVSDEMPLSLDVIDRRELDRAQMQDIRDVARDLPNVSVRHAPSRFAVTGPANNTGREGNAGFSIRGLGGNRVLMMVDGIRVPRSYAFGANAFGRDQVSLDLVKRVEVVRGAASALYGSDGMAGLVNFITAEPSDFLGGASAAKAFGGRAAASYAGDDDGWAASATVAARAGDVARWMLTASGRRAHGTSTMGDIDRPDAARTTANPQQDRDRSVLGKLVLQPGGGQKHLLTLEHVDRESQVNLLSSRAARPLAGNAATQAAAVLDENGSMALRRDRFTWDGRWKPGVMLADNLQVVAGVQRAASRQLGFSDLNARPDRERDVRYDERTWQLGVQADRTARLADGWTRTLTYGVDHVRSRIANLYTGVNSLPPEVFPLKRFPDTRETSSAAYVQSEWADERWTVVPGVRVDHFALEVLSQDLFSPPAARPGRSLSGSAVSPKLGVMYRPAPEWSVFGSHAAGFRAPNAHQVNGYYENAAEFVQVIPNPDLQPEKSRTLEIGARARLARLTLDVAAFTGRFSNLVVDNVLVSGTGVAGDPKLFQTRNVERARIRGLEAKGRAVLGHGAGGGWAMPFAWGTTRGVNATTGRPLNGVDPWQAMLGLEYQSARWDARIDVRHVAAKKAEAIDSAGLVKPPNTQFTTPSATTVDVSAQWRVRDDLRLTASVVNLTNRKYWVWADVQGLAASTIAADAWTQPGRHLRVSLVADF
jgi:hemoglobin/transferrin/lactoferrin receptor protein